MDRIVEPELMDDVAQAVAYADADFDEPNTAFVQLFTDAFPDFSGTMLDLGCGPGDIALRFARLWPGCRVHAVDGSKAMLDCGRERLAAAGEPGSRVTLIEAVLPDAKLPQSQYDAVISNSLLHHLHDPHVLWEAIQWRAAPGAPVVVMDLRRPESEAAARDIVETYAAEEPPVLKQDFFNSLLAAFEPGEVCNQLQAAGLRDLDVRIVSDRHLAVVGRRPA